MARSKPPRVKPNPAARPDAGLELIDAPWRHEYFDSPKARGCFICRAIADKLSNDRKNLLLVRGENAVIVLNRYPYTMGALMVAPGQHLAGFRDLDEDTLLEIMRLIRRGMDILDRALNPKGYNIGVNQGKEAGAGLDAHVHIHVVPRWGADTNFMTTVAGARVIAESTESMFRRLKRAEKEISISSHTRRKRKRA